MPQPGIRHKGYNRKRSKKRDRRLGKVKYDENGKKVDDRDTAEGANLGFKDIERENPMFDKFYRAQKFCSDEDFDKTMEVLKTDLPASFRITGTRSHAKVLLKIIEGQYFKELTEFLAQGGNVVIPKVLPWYPDNLAYQLNATRKDIRREEIYFKLHNFLVAETECGSISRQETVSMIPPLVLGVEPHHKVLDMCAAPGSKTTQLMEAVHDLPEGELPSGFVVANDSDNSRCYMLTHQVKRLQSPCIVITNHDAACMPNIYVPDQARPGKNTPLKFDRILCDVPCTGDGTLRKNADIWPKWNPVNSVNLHGVQYRIAKRGLELLEVGGRMVYSTCSFNPIEDEAVLARLLQETGDSVRLVDMKDKLPGLEYSPGLTTWQCASKHCDIYSKFEEVPEQIAKVQIRPSMFPPPPEVAEKLGLEKCARLLPHHQNTGGFFVALLEKVGLCPWESVRKASKRDGEASENIEEDDEVEGTPEPEPPKKKFKGQNQGFREDPIFYFGDDEEVFPEIQKYFDLSLPCNLFLTRCRDETKKKNLFFTNAAVKQIVENNRERVKIINTGVKAFTRADNKGSTCEYRLAQEGCLSTIPFIKNRVVRPGKEDIIKILQSSEIEKPPEIKNFTQELREEMHAIPTGSLAFVYKDLESGMSIEMVGWKGKETVRAYVPKNERLHYLRLVGADTSMWEVNKFEEKKEKDRERKEAREKREKSLNGDLDIKLTENHNSEVNGAIMTEKCDET